MVRKAYAPGPKAKRRAHSPSEYSKELAEKQKLRNWYGLGERQFSNYVKSILSQRGKVENASNDLIALLESRLDNAVFRMGFAASRAQARQMVTHGFFNINGKSIDTPSYLVKSGDVITLKPQKAKKTIFQNIKNLLKNAKAASWTELDAEKLEGKIKGKPSIEEVQPPAEITAIFEFYSR